VDIAVTRSGNRGGDLLVGGEGTDVLIGEAGTDHLVAGSHSAPGCVERGTPAEAAASANGAADVFDDGALWGVTVG
jgi:Ca2+-binding RTX toxin-like protein